ncbi:MAG TPA: hypothetical protein VF546_15510 [Pyrinomonadaceae bacterium]|jgi:hypothetical protein
MKQLLIIITLAVLSSACGASARRGGAFSGSVRSLVPQQVGEFKLAGEVKALDIVRPNEYQGDAAPPTEGVSARYEAAGKTPLFFQVVNYRSAADAEHSLNQWKENVQKLGKGAKYSDAAVGAGPNAKPGILVEGLAPGMHQAVWVDRSLVYLLAGDNLQSIQAFQQSLP